MPNGTHPRERENVRLENFLDREPPVVYLTDLLFYRMVVIMLGIVAIGSLVAIVFLFLKYPDKPAPESLTALGSVALGALAGLFTSGKNR